MLLLGINLPWMRVERSQKRLWAWVGPCHLLCVLGQVSLPLCALHKPTQKWQGIVKSISIAQRSYDVWNKIMGWERHLINIDANMLVSFIHFQTRYTPILPGSKGVQIVIILALVVIIGIMLLIQSPFGISWRLILCVNLTGPWGAQIFGQMFF